ncbi:hypothetical protein BU14_0085s0030 [Porphyra umbilicalis]|uniref:HMG domain-containing protein n=1 Tax=Porphyra umbilicalis TaxID=2786 RepID=A0A1X6PE63_PORUM|nr:hypothetical protein BU14_0085s0030 [Porphyra umbilicalis]|eukprot:OSX79179.1 hypothetical protein BU14_0085s0030 [Porphyra umbilicalis]
MADIFGADRLPDERTSVSRRRADGRATRAGNYAGWRGPGPGRGRGRGPNNVRESMRPVLVALFCNEMHKNLLANYEEDGVAARALVGLEVLRVNTGVSKKSLRTRGWTLGRSGAVGVLLKLGRSRVRSDVCKQHTVAISVALEAVRSAAQMTLEEVFEVLESSVRGVARAPGTAIPWPFAVVRRTIAKRWVCIACPTADSECIHQSAAVAAAAGDGDGGFDDGDDGTPTMRFPDDDPVKEGGHPVAPDNPYMLFSRFYQVHQSRLLRDLVPPSAAQQTRINLVKAAATSETILEFPCSPLCPFCRVSPSPLKPPIPHECRIEFDDGSVMAKVYSWRCPNCLLRVMPDGREHDLVFSSPFTAYSKAFLFELAVNLSRNGCSLRSSSYLRSGYSELTASLKYAPRSSRLRSVATLRKALTLYLSLVIKGLPLDVSTCARCVSSSGVIDIVCFDGLQLGYKLKYKRRFQRHTVRTSAIPRASVHAHMVTDSAVAKALGSVFNTTSKAVAGSSKTVTTVTSMRSYVMAVSALLGSVSVNGREESFAGPEQHGTSASTAGRGWCPTVDGGVRPALPTFLRRFFRCELVARSLCTQVLAASFNLFRRVLEPLMTRIQDVVRARPAEVEPAPNTTLRHGLPPPLPAGSIDVGVRGAESDESEVEDSDEELTSADDRVSFDGDSLAAPRRKYWDTFAPLARFAKLFTEPALADTGRVKGTMLEADMLFRLQPSIPTTAAAPLKVVDFVRAVTVDPFVVWAPDGDWGAIDALVDVLSSDNFTSTKLAAVLDRSDVCELRLLRAAVACLGPGLERDAGLRPVLADLLTALKDTAAAYDSFVAVNQVSQPGGDDGMAPGDGDQPPIDDFTKAQMASAHPLECFTPAQYTATWMEPPASVASFKAAYGITDESPEDFLSSGVWAPNFPVLRPIPLFYGTAQAATDEPDCNHLMGKENKYTGGTFGAFCTCTHPKCIGVVVLDGSEGQRMPIEFITQRCATLPSQVVYDFSCATLKTALCRLPLVARAVSFLVDRFHWRKNHVSCTKAMNPDSYSSMESINTSSSEERNALSRRQEHHLRLMNQDNYIIFTTYQQALSNVIAMYKDVETELTPSKWPRWYRQKYVDGVGNTERGSAGM